MINQCLLIRLTVSCWLQALSASKVLLKGAILKSHGSHTAKWLTETSAACIDMGLQSTVLGLRMLPISYQHLATCMQGLFHEPKELLDKLQRTTGQKYFTLSGPMEMPSTVMLNLASIIHPPARTADVVSLLGRIQIIAEHGSFFINSKPPLLPAGYSKKAPSFSHPADSLAVSDMHAVNVSTLVCHCFGMRLCFHFRHYTSVSCNLQHH